MDIDISERYRVAHCGCLPPRSRAYWVQAKEILLRGSLALYDSVAGLVVEMIDRV